jgi:DNA sulfur modification protein DndB
MGDETISVLLCPYENLDRVQQMFSDLNRYVAKTSKSLDILYDKRDPISKVTVLITELVPVFEGMVEKDTVSLGARSPKLFSLAALYDANQELLRFHTEGQDDEGTINYLAKIGAEFWEAVSAAMPSWQLAKEGRIRSIDVRQESIASHSTVLRAIGAAGGELMKERPMDWKTELMKLKEIDWSKGNKDWDGICIVANSVVSNRQARAATKAYIKRHLGLPLTEGELRALAKPEIERSVAAAVTELAAELEGAIDLVTPRSGSTTH